MITSKDKRWMGIAGKLLKHSLHPKYKISCLIVKGNSLISTGVNKLSAPKRFTKPHRSNLHLHGEIDSLLFVDPHKVKGATAYVNGETAAGNSLLTKPCLTCEGFLLKMGIRRIVYNDKETIREMK